MSDGELDELKIEEVEGLAKSFGFKVIGRRLVRRHRVVYRRTIWESANVDIHGNRSGAVSHRNLIDALSRPVVFVDFASMVERSASAARSALALASFDQTVSRMQYSRLCVRALQKWPGVLKDSR